MSEIIAITNQKGGVGKTTTAYNLAASLARYNKRVLLLDMDPQGNCSQALGIDPTLSKRTMSELLLKKSDLKHCIRKTNFENISIISANLTLAMVESTLLTQGECSTKLLKEILNAKELNLFDYVLIDCPPSLGFLSLNALNASDCILIPVQCEYFALDALAQLLSTLYNVQKKDNPDLSILGILLTMYDPRTFNRYCKRSENKLQRSRLFDNHPQKRFHPRRDCKRNARQPFPSAECGFSDLFGFG